MNIICLDTETTGLRIGYDEILQLSIIDGDSNVLFSEYFKPAHRRKWTEAERINHISPDDVRNCQPLLHYQDDIQRILASADIIVGYNIAKFDLPMLFENGIINDVKDGSIVVDVMLAHSYLYGDYDEKRGTFSFVSLRNCASFYSYKGTKWHDALDDATATLYCFYKLFNNPPQLSLLLDFNGHGVFPSDSQLSPKHTPDSTHISSSQPTSTLGNKPKIEPGSIMVACSFLVLIISIVSLQFGGLIIAALLFFFGMRKYSAFKKSVDKNIEGDKHE